jgi:murein DD-endopeptidase MepM/ murein hydrolase activator NlpD
LRDTKKQKGEWIFILGKWVKYYTKETFKALKVVLIGTAIILTTVFIKYKPAYKVTFAGETLGYITNKKIVENNIENYKNDRSGNIAFIEVEELPTYEFKLVNRGEETKEKEVLLAVENNSTITYKTFAITIDGNEKTEVATEEEANSVIETVKQDVTEGVELNFGINEVYTTQLAISSSDDAISALNEVKEEKTQAYKEEQERKAAEEAAAKAAAAAKAKAFAIASATSYASAGSIGDLSLSQPVSGSISSRFGSVSSIRSSAHTGLDIAATKGTGITAAASGTVTFAGWQGSYGNLIKIDHGNGVETWYAHCNAIYVSVGDSVDTSTTIGAVGSTGNSTGPHLHLEIRINGTAVNPQNYLYK